MATVAHIAGVAPATKSGFRPASSRADRRAPVARRAVAINARCAASNDDADVDESVRTTRGSMNSSRRGILSAAASIATTALSPLAGTAFDYPAPDVVTLQENFWAKATREAHPERWYPYWWALPLAPYGSKATAMAEVVPGQVWTFDQLQGLLDVLVNVRMTVVAMANGGLWVHNPVAPTQELMDMLAPIVDTYGPVKHIVVGSAAIEHKIYSGPFSKKFPAADVWLPRQNWTFPVDVPIDTYVPYYPRGSPKYLPLDSTSGVGAVPWGDEIEHYTLEVGGSSLRNFKDPWFVDTAFYHKKSRTMLVTDVVLHVSQDPVPVATIEPEPLLVRGMDAPDRMLPNTAEARSAGWGKTVLFGLLFNPAAVDVRIDPSKINKSFLDGFYWESKWKDAFRNLTDKDMFVPPILHTLAFPRRRDEVKRWAECVAAWDFERIIPGHLDGPIDATPKQFAAAIDVALSKSSREVFGEDIDTLEQIDKISRDLKSLEEPRPLSDPSPVRYYTPPPPEPMEQPLPMD